MYTGSDIIVVEKFGTVAKMVPFTETNGVAFLESQGFVSEYGIALARIAAGQNQLASIYTDGKTLSQHYACNLDYGTKLKAQLYGGLISLADNIDKIDSTAT